MADNENYIENIQFGEDEEIYPIRDAEAHEEIDEVKEDYVEKENGELADTIVTYEDEETTVSSFTDFISNFISGSKVAKWFKDFRAGVEYILHVGSLVNNCVTDNAELPLSAAQGKVLMDELTSVKSDLTELSSDVTALDILGQSGTSIPSYADLNDYTSFGKYYSNNGTISETLSNCPSVSGGFTLFVVNVQNNSRFTQIIIAGYTNIIHFRSWNSSSWSSWQQVSTTASAMP